MLPTCWTSYLELAWSLRQTRRKRHFHSRSDDRQETQRRRLGHRGSRRKPKETLRADARRERHLKSPLDCSRHVIAQLLSSLQRPLDPHNLQFPRRNLSCRFVVRSGRSQTTFVTGEHSSKDRGGALLRLGMHAAEADQSFAAALRLARGRKGLCPCLAGRSSLRRRPIPRR